MVSTALFILSGLLIGAAFGFILQRGRFCMNSAYREILFGDYTLLRAYFLAVVITMIGANAMEDLGLLGHAGSDGMFVSVPLERQAFAPWANIIGGYLFGIGIVLAGGCGSGILYRLGEGSLSSMISLFGFFFGIGATQTGLLSPLYDRLLSYQVPPEGPAPTLNSVLGLNKWIVIAVISAFMLAAVFRGLPARRPGRGMPWPLTGVAIGLVAAAAWWVSAYFGGRARGLSFTGPVRELFLTILFGNYLNDPSAVVSAESRSVLGATFSWSALYVAAVPVGAHLSAVLLREVKLRLPPACECMQVLAGGIIMGIGAELGGGCNIGHGLTGVSTLAVSSWIANACIILGNWTAAYFLFIRPMKKSNGSQSPIGVRLKH